MNETVSLTPAQQIEEEDGRLRVEYLDRDAGVEVETLVEQPARCKELISLVSVSPVHCVREYSCFM